jgi:MFS family permease
MMASRLPLNNLAFFAGIGFIVDAMNFGAIQIEIFAADRAFAASVTQLGILGTLGSLGYTLPAFFSGMLSEKYGRRPVCTLALLALSLCYFAGAWSTNVYHIWTECFIRAAITAFIWPPVMAWIADTQPGDSLPKFLSWYNISWAAGGFAGFYGAGEIFAAFGWKAGFYTAAALSLLMAIYVSVFMPGRQPHLASDKSEDLYSHSPQEIQYYVLQGMVMLGLGMFLTGLVMYMFPKLAEGHVNEKWQGILNAMRMAGAVTAFFAFGLTKSWHFRRWPAVVIAAAFCAGLLLTAWGSHLVTYFISFYLVGIGFGTGFTVCAYYALGLVKTKGKGSGMMETLIGAGGLLGPIFGGQIAAQASPRAAILCGFVPLAVGTAFAFLARKKVAIS